MLERIQDYEKRVTKINLERNIVKRENQFFKVIISKLNDANIRKFEKQDKIFAPIVTYCSNPMDQQNKQNIFDFSLMNALTQSTAEENVQKCFKYKHKLTVNISKQAGGTYCQNHLTTLTTPPRNYVDFMLTNFNPNEEQKSLTADNNDNVKSSCDDLFKCGSGIPIRYTLSDSNLFRKSNNNFLTPNSTIMYCNNINCRDK